MWKIADFGLTSYGTSRKAITTHYSRGTAAYLAPEFLEEIPTYTNKVDIWAMGCIFFEVVFRKRAFANDFFVYQYALRSLLLSIPLESENIPEPGRMSFLSKLIREMLEIEPLKRPRAEEVHRRCNHWDIDGVNTQIIPAQATTDTPEFVKDGKLQFNDGYSSVSSGKSTAKLVLKNFLMLFFCRF